MKEALYDFFFGSNNKRTDYLYDTPHLVAIISTIVACVAMIILARFLSKKQKRIVLWIFFGIFLAFEIMHRIYRFVRGHAWYEYIPTHFSSIAVWMVIIAVPTKNRHLLNLSALSTLLASGAFLAYPGVGFNVDVLKFTNYYSIITHCLGFVYGCFVISGGVVAYKWRELWVTIVYFVILYLHSFLFNFVIFPGSNYLYYVENDTSLPYGLFLVGYCAILIVYVLSFYLGYSIRNRCKNKRQKTE